MKVTRFHHVSVNCNDTPLAEMVSFYGGLFGLDSKERPEIPGIPGHWFNVSDQELHVVGAPPQRTEIDSTGNHYCIAVEDLDKAIAELEDQKIPYERAVQGGARFRFGSSIRPGTRSNCSKTAQPTLLHSRIAKLRHSRLRRSSASLGGDGERCEHLGHLGQLIVGL